MDLIGFIKNTITLLKMAKKPSGREYSITLRNLFGLAIIGFLALAFQVA